MFQGSEMDTDTYIYIYIHTYTYTYVVRAARELLSTPSARRPVKLQRFIVNMLRDKLLKDTVPALLSRRVRVLNPSSFSDVLAATLMGDDGP